MHILFCSEPFRRRKVDSFFERESAEAGRAGFDLGLVDFEALVESGRPFAGTGPLAHPSLNALYRGWMLRASDYEQLYSECAASGLRLINSPEQCVYCHHLPAGFSAIKAMTARTVWMEWADEGLDERILDAVTTFGDKAIIVKDYVKSEKHHWEEACFIPNASDRERVLTVTKRFLELRGGALEGGLVFREFLDLEPIGAHSASGMPQFREYRLFFLDQKVLACVPYWERQEPDCIDVPLEKFENVAEQVNSRFFTMDVALHRDGRWMIVELGDGQVAGLPEQLDPGQFYQKLWDAFGGES